MKKLVFLGAVTVMAAGVALASSLNVPFFLDNGTNEFPPATGTAGFIGLHNNTDDLIICEVNYINPDGTTSTPADNTFVLPANASISWRPCTDAPAEGPEGSAVPNKAGLPKAGSAVISWEGGPNDIQGRYAEYTSAAAQNSSSYTLPPGL